MVTDIRKFDHTVSYGRRVRDEKFLSSRLHEYSKAQHSFTIKLPIKSNVAFARSKKIVEKISARQISSYLRMPVVSGSLYIKPLERGVAHGEIFVHEDIETLPEFVKVAQPIEISYVNQALVKTLLGSHGRSTLEKVLSLVKSLARGMDWPLVEVEIRYIRDPEVKDWEYVLLMLVFTCDFDTADKHLYELYDQIDILIDKLSAEEQEILQRKVFLDIKTKTSIPSA